MKENKTIQRDPLIIKEIMLKKYPPKIAKKREKSIIANDSAIGKPIQANVRTVPGIITQRGCTYAGCKGVVLGPTRDIINITHGPIGCGYYSWLTRRNQTKPESPEDPNYMNYCFSTDMQDSNIVFGGMEKLKLAIREAYQIFKPKNIAVFSTCPVGLIGDDVHSVAREMKKELGINVFGFSCEGYRGVSQSAGHHIANNGLLQHVIGLDDTTKEGKWKVNLLGEYNIGGDAFELERIMEKIGITLIATFSGNSTMKDFERSHTADLNMVMCHRSINYAAEMMEKKYGIPWIKVNFIGAESTAKSLRKMGEYFEDEELKKRIEAVIEEEMPEVAKVIDSIRPRTKNKLAMLFVGGSRAHHYQDLFKELGMKTVSAGYEFAHRDDYEGRHVIPSIQIDADSRNIEELDVEVDTKRYRKRKKDEVLDEMNKKGMEVRDYYGMMAEMEKNALVIDDISHWESEKLIDYYKPDIFCAGIKEKYVIQKMGVPLKQLHSYDYGGPYAGFKGAINFYKDIDMMVGASVWRYLRAPWERHESVEANFVIEPVVA
jgi:nitrogenase molybdenum-iron protein alpha chain